MPDIKCYIEKSTTMRVTLKPEEIEPLIRNLVGAPPDATIEFDAGCDRLRDITVRWTEFETSDD